MEKGLVSVVIPTYNRMGTIERAIDSALMQDYAPLEVVVVGDGAPEALGELILRRSRTDGRVRYVRKENGGVCTARNRGLQEARGEFIAMLDDDDCWLPGKLRLQIDLLKRHPEVSLVWSDFDAINPAGEVVGTRLLRKAYHAYAYFPAPEDLFSRKFVTDDGIPYYIGDISWQMVLGNLIHTSTVVARADRLQQAGWYDQACNPSEDQDYYFRVCRTGPVAFVDAVTLHYRMGSPDALSGPSQSMKLAKSYLKVINKILDAEGDAVRPPAHLLRDALLGGYRWAGRAHFDEGLMADARGYFRQALRVSPADLQSAVFLAASFLPRNAVARLRAFKRFLGLKLPGYRQSSDLSSGRAH